MSVHTHPHPHHHHHDHKLEIVTACVGFDDFLDVAIEFNHPHVDNYIVVTSHSDHKTQAVCRKHGVQCVQTDLFKKNGREFNKGAALNAGMNYFQFNGWRLNLDADILLPDNFRRLLFNHHHLDKDDIYGCDRVDVIGKVHLDKLKSAGPQHKHGMLMQPGGEVGSRYVDLLDGYLPLGYFQLWNAKCQKPYPHSLGTAAHDDIMFSALWPRQSRKLLPGMIVYHLCAAKPVWGENWDGNRKQPRLW